MKALDILALAKCVNEKTLKEVREKVKPGTYDGDLMVKVAYSMTVGEDTEATPAASIPWQDIAIAALNRLSKNARAECIDAGFHSEVDETVKDELTAILKLRAERIADASPKNPKKGAVKLTANIEEVKATISEKVTDKVTLG